MQNIFQFLALLLDLNYSFNCMIFLKFFIKMAFINILVQVILKDNKKLFDLTQYYFIFLILRK